MIMTEYIEIREILARWYQGDTSPAEQQRLQEFFAADRDLPGDLAMEREVFRAMSAVDENDVDIPENLSARIDTALRTEIARERNAAGIAKRWRRRIIAACGAAACLVAGMTIYSLVSTDHNQMAPDTRMTVTAPAAIPSATPDTAVSVKTEPVSVPSARVASAHAIARKAPRKAKRNIEPVQYLNKTVAETDMYLTEAEEQQLIANNYRVVRDEREADAILCSVFNRLDCSITEEYYRMSAVNAKYEMETTKLYN